MGRDMTKKRKEATAIAALHDDHFYSKASVAKTYSISVSTLERAVRDGEHPAPLQITKRRVAFRGRDVRAWQASR
jgi:predicted DNA-binding transcriptional regulator AlpA